MQLLIYHNISLQKRVTLEEQPKIDHFGTQKNSLGQEEQPLVVQAEN
mgnify:CR=1 FL=1